MQIKASAPGSLMLLGEYAVLYGQQALVCAVDKRINVTLTPREDERIEIYSSLHGQYTTELSQLSIEKPFQFVLGVLKQYQPVLRRGCRIDITTAFSDKMGLGSSSAVTVATLAAVVTWLNIRMTPLDMIRQGRHVVRQVQGVGSGADIAAAVYGGIVNYQAQPIAAEKFHVTCPLTALYAGFKTSTVEAIKHVQQQFSARQQLFRQINMAIGQCVVDAIPSVRKGDWAKLGEVMNIQQGMMESLGVSSPLLQAMVNDLRRQPGVCGAKISGSGLGDCVIAIGELPESYVFSGEGAAVQRIPVAMTLQGVQCEKS